MTRVAWVIGSRGLLGRAIGKEIAARTDWTQLAVPPLAWGEQSAVAAQVADSIARLLRTATALDADWSIIWAAGAANTASSAAQLDAELEELTSVLAAIDGHLGGARRGSIFFASSAGGVYAGSPHPPHSESSVTAPLSPYGAFKLRAEEAVTGFAERNRLSSLLGRIANLYGPGQKLEKMQGLISHIAKAQYSPTPAGIYVPLDTMRDYIFVSDCAALICDAIDRLGSPAVPEHVIKILASGTGVTIATLLGQFRVLTKRRPNVMLGTSASAAYQARDLRLRSTVWPELDARALTPLAAGIHATMEDVLLAIQASKVR